MGKDSEVTFVTGGLIIFVFAIILLLKHSYNTSYQENHEYFIIKIGKKEHKIKYIIVSGDNMKRGYNEPVLMRTDLMKEGIDSSVIFLDYAGFRTFDSVVRSKEVFGQKAITIISQKFHNERAVFLASREGITAVGFNAKDVNPKYGQKTNIREKLARVKVFIDIFLRTDPKFLGKKVVIPG